MQAYSQYFANDKDASEYQIKHVVYSILLFVCLAAYAKGFLTLGITYVISDFVFFHLVHYRGGRLGTFRD